MKLSDDQKAALPDLLAEIKQYETYVAGIQALVSDPTSYMSGTVSVTSETGGPAVMQFASMTPEESSAFFTGALAVFEARLAALNERLAAL